MNPSWNNVFSFNFFQPCQAHALGGRAEPCADRTQWRTSACKAQEGSESKSCPMFPRFFSGMRNRLCSFRFFCLWSRATTSTGGVKDILVQRYALQGSFELTIIVLLQNFDYQPGVVWWQYLSLAWWNWAKPSPFHHGLPRFYLLHHSHSGQGKHIEARWDSCRSLLTNRC